MQVVQRAFSYTFSDCRALWICGLEDIISYICRMEEIKSPLKSSHWILPMIFSVDAVHSSKGRGHMGYLPVYRISFHCAALSGAMDTHLSLGTGCLLGGLFHIRMCVEVLYSFGDAPSYIYLHGSERSGQARRIIPRSLHQTLSWSFGCLYVSIRCPTTDTNPAILLSNLIEVSGSHLSAENKLAHWGYREVRGISEASHTWSLFSA